MKKVFSLSAILLLLIYVGQTQTFPTGFTTTTIGSGWTQPVGATFTPDGLKMFVWEKAGIVYVLNRQANGTYTKQTTAVINISEEVGNWRDHGLLGFALDPNFGTNGYIYLLYEVDRHYLMNFGTASYNAATNTYNQATIGRVTRYQTTTSAGNLVANMGSRKILLGETRQTGIPLLYESHGIGSLAFAADGTLLLSTGDGASYESGGDWGSVGHTYFSQALTDGIIRQEENVGAFRSQMLNSHDGKILRIDPATGDGIPSNPFYTAADPRSAKSRTWALGFRNPFRFSIKPGTGSTNRNTGDIGEIYIGDVGWNTWEELNIINTKGANCGWPLYEGQNSLSTYFNQTTQNKDEANPLYNGTTCTQQFFTFKNLLKQATADNNTTVFNPCNNAQAIGNNNRYFHHRPAMDWQHGADVARVGTFSGNTATVATIGTAGSGVTGTPFRGNCTVGGCWYNGTLFPPDYQNTYFMADLGGDFIRVVTIDFVDQVQKVQTFATGFTDLVCLVQNPLDGKLIYVDVTAQVVKSVSFGGNQPPVAKITANKTFGPTTLAVNFTGSQSTDVGGSISSYLWEFGDATTSTATNPSHSFTAPVGTAKKFTVKLTVTDNGGATDVDSIIISVNNTPPSVSITNPIKNSLYKVGKDSTHNYTAAVSDLEQSGSGLTYSWQTILRHSNHQHADPLKNSITTTELLPGLGCNGDEYYWHIELTVTDAGGLSTTDSSNIFPNCAQSPLPLTLRKFSVTQDGNSNIVRWTTEQEENMEYFEVERSTNGVDFSPINRQAAKNLPLPNSYDFIDKSFSSGVNYYRLKMAEIDRKYKYSIIVKTTTSLDDNGIGIVPNPNKGSFGLTYSSQTTEPLLISIRDAAGKLIKSKTENVSRGSNVIYIDGMEKATAGVYIIYIEQGSQLKQTKFVKVD